MNRAATIITGNFDYDVRGVELLKQLGLMNVKERRDYFMSMLVFKCVNGTAPFYLCNVLTPAASIHTLVNTSVSDNLLYIPYVNRDLFKQYFEYRAPALWNSLPSHLRKAPNVDDFKKLYKLFNRALGQKSTLLLTSIPCINMFLNK